MSDIPDYFHALIGYRRFAVRDRGTLLVSANYPQPWPGVDPGPAVCISENRVHAAGIETIQEHTPALECTCGYYCYKDATDVKQHAQGTIIAKVEVWGRIVQHARGYRAARMKLVEIYVPKDANAVAVAGLQTRYGIPIIVNQEMYTWTSDSPNGSSSASPLQNLSPSLYQPWNPPPIQAQAQYNQQIQYNANYQNAFPYPPFVAPPALAQNASSAPTPQWTSAITSAGTLYYVVSNSGGQLTLTSNWEEDTATELPAKPAPRQYFNFYED